MTRLLVGDALEQLATLPDESVHCCITSPPYWGLRSYLPTGSPDKALELGAEKTPEEYVARLVDVFSEVRRVLRDDGVCWLNLGDSYVSSPRGNAPGDVSSSSLTNPSRQDEVPRNGGYQRPPGLKPKDLCLIPYRVALALQSDGWYLRSHVIWAKGVSFCEHYSGSVMPESVRDRPTSAHEAVFLLTKSERYWYDADAVREASSEGSHGGGEAHDGRYQAMSGRHDSNRAMGIVTPTRNLRNVWAISPRSYSGSHYAVFPAALVAPMLKAGCPAKVCAECGAPWPKDDVPDDQGDRFVCRHFADDPDGSTVGGLALDPFIGSGTVAQVAQDYGRRWIGIDLDPRNAALIHKRTAQQSLLGRAR